MRGAAILALVLAMLGGGAFAAELTPEQRRGKRLYVEGLLADGRAPGAAIGSDGFVLRGRAMPCASCHGPDGLGRPEGDAVPSNVTWFNLTKPYGQVHDNGRRHGPYDEAAVIAAVTGGVDPAGNELHTAMPRYRLDAEAARDLVAYLKLLGSESDHGVREDRVVIGTLVPRGGPLEDVGEVAIDLLAAFVDEVNAASGIFNRRLELVVGRYDGPEEAAATARRLVAAADIFALVAPVAVGAEAALAEFAESEKVPLIAPLVMQPPADAGLRRYGFYLTSGPLEQGRSLVERAWSLLGAGSRPAILLGADGDAAVAAAIAAQAEERHGWKLEPPLRLPAAGDELAETLARLRDAEMRGAFYVGGAAGLLDVVAAAGEIGWAADLFANGGAVSRAVAAARPQAVRIHAALPLIGRDQSAAGAARLRALRERGEVPARHHSAQVATFAGARLLAEGMRRAGRDLTRAKLVKALGSLWQFQTGVTPPVTFGINRRIGLLGAHVVAVDGNAAERGTTWVSLE
jgi:ABC-type branched-subunit amino acid transport system substrate-binding protein